MSCFSGSFAHLPGVACDNFVGQNLNADQFFLSHCHSDHMRGLDLLGPSLRRQNIVKVNHCVYCSSMSKAILVRKYPNLDEKYVRELFPHQAVGVNVFDKAKKAFYKLRVTGVPAEHCPGSIMFLFERLSAAGEVDHRILYTGDFRYEDTSEVSSMRSLHGVDGAPLKIDEMYLDTTFCSSQYQTFPKRKEAIDRIWNLVEDWVRKNGRYRHQRAKHVVLLQLPAQYGSEAILKHIYEQSRLKWRIHVSDSKFQEYLCVDELGDCTDSDARVAQWVHACAWKGGKRQQQCSKTLPCQQGPFEVRQIKPSAMYFSQQRMSAYDKVVKCVGGQSYRVCYSCHSSLAELMEFVEHFRPQTIIPCVVPAGSSYQKVLETFKPLLGKDNLDVEVSLGSLNGLSRVEGSSSSSPEKDCLLQNFWSSPDSNKPGSRKRRSEPLVVETQCVSKRVLLDKTATCSPISDDSSDDGGLVDTGLHAQSKRKIFQRTRANASMPVAIVAAGGTHLEAEAHQKARRASLPGNIKIPDIRITPSSPSPDPNHPDYPEFFEDRLYLESKSLSTSSSGGEEIMISKESRDMDVDHERDDSLRLSISPKDIGGDSSSLEICYESIEMKRPAEVIDISSDTEYEASVDEMEESTPELDFVIEKAKTPTEVENCHKFARGQAKKRLVEKD